MQHVHVITSRLWKKRANTYLKDMFEFIDTWFTTLLASKYDSMKFYTEPTNAYCGLNLKSYVTDKSMGRLTKTELLKNVDVIYVPMMWIRHWIGLVVNLRVCIVEILDPHIAAHTDEEVEALVGPITHTLPFLLKNLLSAYLTMNLSTSS